jgi:hypothetical protein
VMSDATHEGQPSHIIPKIPRDSLPTQGIPAGGAIVSGPRQTPRGLGRVWGVREQHGLVVKPRLTKSVIGYGLRVILGRGRKYSLRQQLDS